MGLLGDPEEHQYQTFMAFDPAVRAWRNAFVNRHGEQPQTEGGDYDYRAAYAAGSRPQPVPGDTVPHWSSVGKSADHPTMWKQNFMTQFGTDPDQVERWTPEMQQFMRQHLSRSLIGGGDPQSIPGLLTGGLLGRGGMP